jgi:hypothetical protein
VLVVDDADAVDVPFIRPEPRVIVEKSESPRIDPPAPPPIKVKAPPGGDCKMVYRPWEGMDHWACDHCTFSTFDLQSAGACRKPE